MTYPKDGNEAAWLWSFLLHSESTFHNRTNLFLVAESMLIAATAAL